MKLTRATDYALILLSHLARLEPGMNTSVKKIAMCSGVPKRFLAIIVHRLSTLGMIISVKGMNGGIRLGRPSSKITLRDVVEAIEGPIGFVECQKQVGLCQLEDNCSTKPFWDAVHENILKSLSATTIEDLTRFMPEGIDPFEERIKAKVKAKVKTKEKQKLQPQP